MNTSHEANTGTNIAGKCLHPSFQIYSLKSHDIGKHPIALVMCVLGSVFPLFRAIVCAMTHIRPVCNMEVDKYHPAS